MFVGLSNGISGSEIGRLGVFYRGIKKSFVRGIIGYKVPNAQSKQLILSVLRSTTTKREAKDYLNKYDNPSTRFCILYLRDIRKYEMGLLERFAGTVNRLRMLGITPLVVLDPSKHVHDECNTLREIFRLQGILSIPINGFPSSKILAELESASFTKRPLTAIILPLIYDVSLAKTALIKDRVAYLAGLVSKFPPVQVEKIFVIGRLGGLPSTERNDNSHVFINLSQESTIIRKQLQQQIDKIDKMMSVSSTIANALEEKNSLLNKRANMIEHMENLQMMDAVLRKLPKSSTGLLTSMFSAAIHADKNPLIYNIFTDRSLVSSSLPLFKKRRSVEKGRPWYELCPREPESRLSKHEAFLTTTVVKLGLDLKVYDYRTLTSDNATGKIFGLSGSTIMKDSTPDKLNVDKLKSLIENSFGRSLDFEHYLNRINGRIATIIVIGDYDGVAILTYEGLKGREFPYLDKFAVVSHLQGSLCISDIIFNVAFKKFPNELVWRSRRDNVVNKWYFQRSVGVLDLSIDLGDGDRKDSIFKLFYCGDKGAGKITDISRIREYASYVKAIKPSWKVTS